MAYVEIHKSFNVRYAVSFFFCGEVRLVVLGLRSQVKKLIRQQSEKQGHKSAVLTIN